MKTKYIILSSIGVVLTLSFIGKKVTEIRRANTAKKSYGDSNISTAQKLYNALFPEGRPDAKFSIFNPFSSLNVARDVFKSSADIDTVMNIARDDITTENFKKIASGYKKLYGKDLLFDLEDRLDEEKKRFDNIINNKKEASADPVKHKKVLDNLAEKIYSDTHAWGLANDKLYKELYDLSDKDFIYVYDYFNIIADREDTSDTLAEEIADDSWSIDLDEELAERFLNLGLK